ncbi:MAG: hypothetical protein M0R80_03030 [Proteobacteria bacterium]|jgi:hypothetical protein|nr:hypothetical protein [Pseudomonadota bacterium]
MLQRTTKEVAQYFSDNRCELLDEYIGCMNKMKYRCSCGNISSITWNNFTKGKRCGCGSKYRRRYTFEDVNKIFTDYGFVLISNEYPGYKNPLKYKCKCGANREKSLYHFLHNGKHCDKCAHKIMGMKRRNPNRSFERKFKAKMHKALRTCLQAIGKTKAGHTADLLGYGPKDLQTRVTNHPDWHNVKDQVWHLDHIFPIQAFIRYKINDLKLINCLENLRPMNGKENDIKHNRYNKQDFEFWLRLKGAL